MAIVNILKRSELKKRDSYDGVSLGNFGKESGLNEKEKVDEGKTTNKETIKEKITAESTRGKTICRYVSRRKRLSQYSQRRM